MTHGLRSRFRDEESQRFYEVARADIETTGGLDVITDLAAHRVARLQVHYDTSPEDEALERTDAALRAELTVKGLLESRHKIQSERADPQEGELMIVELPACLSHSEPLADVTMLTHVSGEKKPTIKSPTGQLLLETPNGGWYAAIEETVDGELRYWTVPEKLARSPRRSLALVDHIEQGRGA